MRVLMSQKKTESDNVEFLLEDTLDFCTISDVTWFLSKTGNISTLVKFAKLCSGSVEHFNNSYSERADAYAHSVGAAHSDAAYAYTDAAYAAYTDAAYTCAEAAAETAAADVAYAHADVAYARRQQKEKNKQFMIELLAGLE